MAVVLNCMTTLSQRYSCNPLCQTPNITPNPNSFLLFHYDKGTRKESVKYFVGKALQDSNNNKTVLISFLRESQKIKGNYVFPTIADEMSVNLIDICQILKVKSSRRGILNFF